LPSPRPLAGEGGAVRRERASPRLHRKGAKETQRAAKGSSLKQGFQRRDLELREKEGGRGTHLNPGGTPAVPSPACGRGWRAAPGEGIAAHALPAIYFAAAGCSRKKIDPRWTVG
jgi:hypothetical protein